MIKYLQNILNKESVSSWFFIMPSVLGSFLFIVLPVFVSFGISFLKWDLLSSPKFVGVDNYIELFSDPIFYTVLLNTLYYAFCVSVLGVILPLILAVILDRKIKGAEIFKTIYFLPFITPMVVVALVWEWIFDPYRGVLNWFLMGAKIEWLYDPNIAMAAIILVSVWKLIGYNMVLFLAGLSGIDANLSEASKIDGASELKNFFYITVPVLSPTIFFVMIITIISSFQVFDLIYLMTQGGPMNSTNVIVYWLYNNAFEYFKVGEASAIAYVLFFIILGLTALQWKIRRKWVLHE
ncbi:MAG: sugar ABC transporter permease [Candidatus Gastranaerophilales bacterium]|nr:sugar ABC transporter permease [Candidatus Gastranaerophilales bacterium]